MGDYCIRWHGIFKGLSRYGGWAEFSKNPRASLFNEGISNEPILAGSISLDSTFNPWTDIEKYNSSFLLTVLNEMENNRQLTREKVYCNRKMETTLNLNFCTMEMTFFSINVVRVNWIKPYTIQFYASRLLTGNEKSDSWTFIYIFNKDTQI